MPDPTSADPKVGPGQRNHDMSDGCVPSHRSPIAVVRAELNDAEAELDALRATGEQEAERGDALLQENDRLRDEIVWMRQRAERAEAAIDQTWRPEVSALRARLVQTEAAMRDALGFLTAGGPESIAECDGGAWDAAETLRCTLPEAPLVAAGEG